MGIEEIHTGSESRILNVVQIVHDSFPGSSTPGLLPWITCIEVSALGERIAVDDEPLEMVRRPRSNGEKLGVTGKWSGPSIGRRWQPERIE